MAVSVPVPNRVQTWRSKEVHLGRCKTRDDHLCISSPSCTHKCINRGNEDHLLAPNICMSG